LGTTLESKAANLQLENLDLEAQVKMVKMTEVQEGVQEGLMEKLFL
jgi:hypothetical protein